ncbi:putative hydrolase C777.06c, partial [Dendrobium catenatum]|uniref:putative hydrolase C777.06c n=1 Tax=Dendrobium catenatum TaxID=906689 RepID=UPI0010A057E1
FEEPNNTKKILRCLILKQTKPKALSQNGDLKVDGEEFDNGVSSLIFLGIGCSSAVPNARCLILPTDLPCQVCSQSLSLPPEKNPNYSCNTSLLIDYVDKNGAHKYIMIDVGKTFREQVLRWFTHHKIPRVDSIILTHEHADAVLGLDEIRAVQPFSPTNEIDPTPIYITQHAMESLVEHFPYLVKSFSSRSANRRMESLRHHFSRHSV